MTKNIQKGFTLIELMIVVAIIGILAAIAIPAYQDYTIRSQVTEGLNLAAAVKTGVAESFANTGEWPPDLDAAGGDTAAPPSGKYVAEVSVEGGQIRVHKVTAAVDAGVIVNPDGVAAQVEGNVIMGVSSALLEEAIVVDGVLSPANFGAYRILTMAAAPEVDGGEDLKLSVAGVERETALWVARFLAGRIQRGR